MSDLIKREDAIEVTWQEPSYTDALNVLTEVRDRIKDIPPAEPKQGKWIFKTVFPNDKSEFPMGYLVCSVCGSHHSNSVPCNYCDNCGCRMKGADDEQ